MRERSSPADPSKKSGLRALKYIVAGIAFLTLSLTATNIFLQRTSVGSPKFIWMTFNLYTATVMVVLALMILGTILGRNLIKLYFEKKSGQLGSGFKTKMVTTFIVLSLLPALLLFILAYTLITASIEKWFLAPPAQMAENSRVLAQQYYAEAEQRARHFAATIAAKCGDGRLEDALGPHTHDRLRALGREYGLGVIRIIDGRGRLVVDSGSGASTRAHRETMQKVIARALAGEQGYRVARMQPKDPVNELTWASAPIRNSGGEVVGAVLTETLHTNSARFRADSVLEAYDKYQQLEREQAALRFNTLLMLVLATLLIVFAFSWFAMYLAKRITVPIQALAQGAASIAAGDLAHRVECQALDELGTLVAAFNRMTSDLQENEKRIEATQEMLRKSNIEHADRRRYIETILQTIATGVISLDPDYRIQTMNRAAVQMLRAEEPNGENRLESVVQAPACEALRSLLHKSSVLGTVVRNIELSFPGNTLQIAATATPLADDSGKSAGWVVVLDDMTELLKMEKMSAWQEVARRLAHEIKNPLTPIQLSAERILRRYRQLVPGAFPDPQSWQAEFSRFDSLLNECVQAIIQEANALKNLVDEFSRFARLPEVRPEETDVHRILDMTLSLYDGRILDVDVRKEFDLSIPKLCLDPEQMKRVFINLFDNALEAMAESRGGKVLQLRTALSPGRGAVRIEIGDSGRGFTDEHQDNIFLPYFSKRKGGTGLGLAIVRQIISEHHGIVRAEPNAPAGARIVIELPLVQA